MNARNVSARSEHEIAHGQKLAAAGAEDIWGWSSPAGQMRAARRGRLIAQAAGLKPGLRVLEIGCGTGLFTQMFAASGAQIVAVDISAELLVLARDRHLPPQQVQFLEKRFEDCTVDGPFDAVVGSSILHHLELGPALQRIAGLLKPGGRCAFAEPNMMNPQIMAQKNIAPLKRMMGDSPDEAAFVRWSLRRRLAAAGFQSIRIVPFDFLHPATPPSLIPLVTRVGAVLECLPILSEIAGSLLIVATNG